MRKLALTLGLICTIVLLPTAYGVKLYKWVDEDGNVTYNDRPPPEPGYRVEQKDFKLGGETAAKSNSAAGRAAEESPVVLYTAPKCTACDMARAYLDKRKIPFTDKNVSGDAEAIKELQEKTGALTVPTIMVGSKVMKGYMESLLEGELDAAGYPKLEQPTQSTEEAEEQEEQ
ncbi:MAG: glutaredoxin family protein [Gammaproteobacteria bacterium]|jgi:glutaredoxin|nr:glutaredoxin family protein [Gammaproteobacteria bacterium]